MFRRIQVMLISLLTVGFTLCFTSAGFGQNESGTRYLDKGKFQEHRAWYDSTNAMFQIQYPIIRSLPPLSIGMPLDILYSYIYADSLVRFDSTREGVKRIWNWSSSNDTLKNMVKYFYKMQDYNPVILAQYANEVDLKRKVTYRVSLGDLQNALQEKLRALTQNIADRNAMYSLLRPDYILRIKVISKDSMINKRSSLGYYRYSVLAEVIDTLKGNVFQTAYSGSTIKTGGDGHVQSVTHPLIRFQYTPINYFDPEGETDPTTYLERDSAFMTPTGEFTMNVGQEAVVFLRHVNHLSDYQYDYYDLDLDCRSSYNALPITNDNVSDVNHVWLPNTISSYSQWKSRFEGLRAALMSGTF
ncbi:MAG: hypothetical protein ABI876_11185 [Bacteroidota bacterium]